MTIIISIIKVVILLGFLIFIHEAGHMIVAKLCKVKVNEFAIGFGPLIFSKQGKETKYSLRLIPLGGFCAMEGEEERSDTKGSFSKASIPRRILIVLAGAIVNIVFGLIVYFILMSNTGNYVTNQVDETINGYIANEVEIQKDDKIIEINNKKVKSKYDIDKILNKNKGEEIIIKIERNGEIIEEEIRPTEVKNKYTGMYLDKECKLVQVEKGSPAEKQGIKSNDRIIKINGEEINQNTNRAIEILKEKGIGTYLITIKRGNEELNIELEPEYKSKYYLGIKFKMAEDNFKNHIIHAGIETKEFAFSIVDNIKSLFTGKVGVDQMMGPVGISQVVAKTNGFEEFIYMLALISLSLGVTNLLPIPALDGGKLLILIIEAIRKKPMKEELELKIQMIGFSILIGLSIYITYFDILRIIK